MLCYRARARACQYGTESERRAASSRATRAAREPPASRPIAESFAASCASLSAATTTCCAPGGRNRSGCARLTATDGSENSLPTYGASQPSHT